MCNAPAPPVDIDRMVEVVVEYMASREVIVMRNVGGPLPGDLVWAELRTRFANALNTKP